MSGKIITSLPTDIEEQLLALTNNLRKLGVTHIGHGLIVGKLTPTAFFSSKDWARRYDDEDLVSRDPVRACALNSNYRMVPWEYIPSRKEQYPILEERKREFSAKTGLLISIKHKSFHETFVFGTDSGRSDIIQLFKQNSQTFVEHLLLFRKEHMRCYANNLAADARGWERPF